MNQQIAAIIEKHVWAYCPKNQRRSHQRITYSGVTKVAIELGISFDAADELVRDWLDATF